MDEKDPFLRGRIVSREFTVPTPILCLHFLHMFSLSPDHPAQKLIFTDSATLAFSRAPRKSSILPPGGGGLKLDRRPARSNISWEGWIAYVRLIRTIVRGITRLCVIEWLRCLGRSFVFIRDRAMFDHCFKSWKEEDAI